MKSIVVVGALILMVGCTPYRPKPKPDYMSEYYNRAEIDSRMTQVGNAILKYVNQQDQATKEQCSCQAKPETKSKK